MRSPRRSGYGCYSDGWPSWLTGSSTLNSTDHSAVTLVLTTGHLSSVDVYANDRPIGTAKVLDGTNKVTLPLATLPDTTFRIEGFDRNTLVAERIGWKCHRRYAVGRSHGDTWDPPAAGKTSEYRLGDDPVRRRTRHRHAARTRTPVGVRVLAV
jgi:hypothetical protein